MILARRIQLTCLCVACRQDPNTQYMHFAKACGVARFTSIWTLAELIHIYKLMEIVSEAELKKKPMAGFE